MKQSCVFLLFALFLLPIIGVGCKGDEYQAKKAAPGLAMATANYAPEGRLTSGLLQDKKPEFERKIIVSADIRVKVADFAKAEQEFLKLIQTHKGLTAQSEVTGSVGGTRQATWKIRVMPDQLDSFCEAVKKLGELVRFGTDSRDVTEEYFDLKIRLTNKEAELATLRKLYDKGSASMKDVLEIAKEVNRAQVELDQLEGRKRYLDNLTELTTVTVHLDERDAYTPATPLAPVEFGTTVEKTFFGSIDVLIDVARALVLVVVGIGPWLPVLAVPGVAVWLVVRRRRAARLALQDNKMAGK